MASESSTPTSKTPSDHIFESSLRSSGSRPITPTGMRKYAPRDRDPSPNPPVMHFGSFDPKKRAASPGTVMFRSTLPKEPKKERSAVDAPRKTLAEVQFVVGMGTLTLINHGLTSLEGLGIQDALENLFLQYNYLRNFHHLGSQPKLKELHVENNCIGSFAGMKALPKIEHIYLEGNPIAKHPNYRIMAIMAAGPSLRKIDGEMITQQERELAKKLGSKAIECVRAGWLAKVSQHSEDEYDEILEGLRRAMEEQQTGSSVLLDDATPSTSISAVFSESSPTHAPSARARMSALSKSLDSHQLTEDTAALLAEARLMLEVEKEKNAVLLRDKKELKEKVKLLEDTTLPFRDFSALDCIQFSGNIRFNVNGGSSVASVAAQAQQTSSVLTPDSRTASGDDQTGEIPAIGANGAEHHEDVVIRLQGNFIILMQRATHKILFRLILSDILEVSYDRTSGTRVGILLATGQRVGMTTSGLPSTTSCEFLCSDKKKVVVFVKTLRAFLSNVKASCAVREVTAPAQLSSSEPSIPSTPMAVSAQPVAHAPTPANTPSASSTSASAPEPVKRKPAVPKLSALSSPTHSSSPTTRTPTTTPKRDPHPVTSPVARPASAPKTRTPTSSSHVADKKEEKKPLKGRSTPTPTPTATPAPAATVTVTAAVSTPTPTPANPQSHETTPAPKEKPAPVSEVTRPVEQAPAPAQPTQEEPQPVTTIDESPSSPAASTSVSSDAAAAVVKSDSPVQMSSDSPTPESTSAQSSTSSATASEKAPSKDNTPRTPGRTDEPVEAFIERMRKMRQGIVSTPDREPRPASS